MKADELRDLNDDDLHAKIAELKESIFRMRFKLSLGNTDVVKNLRETRKDLARVLTLIRGLSELAGRNVDSPVMLENLVAGTGLPRDFVAKIFHGFKFGAVFQRDFCEGRCGGPNNGHQGLLHGLLHSLGRAAH